MSRILITGGYGFIGTQLLRVLTGHQITVIDSLIGHGGALPENVPQNHTFILGDIRDSVLMSRLLADHDTIVHLAGIVGFPACRVNVPLAEDINIGGTRLLIDLLTPKHKCIFTSSASIYGAQTDDVVTETTKPAPQTEYAEHKIIGEQYLRSSISKYIILRPSTAFGITGRIRLDLLPNTMLYDALVDHKMAVFEPYAVRPFLHAIDYALALVHCIEGNVPWNEIYNITNPDLTMTKERLIHIIANLTGAQIVGKTGCDPDKRTYILDSFKFSATGFQYTPNTIELAYNQMLERLPIVAGRYTEYSSPYQLKKYLERT